VEITGRVYKPRRPRESPLYRLVEQHLEDLLRVWPGRFVRQHGPLRPVAERVLREFLKCALLEQGFAQLWCSKCRRSVVVAFSCRGRSFCPSCELPSGIVAAGGVAAREPLGALLEAVEDELRGDGVLEGLRVLRLAEGARLHDLLRRRGVRGEGAAGDERRRGERTAILFRCRAPIMFPPGMFSKPTASA
jgi:hypothetical protein